MVYNIICIWFWIIIALILALVIYIFVKRRIEFARREQVRLEIKIAERTREIWSTEEYQGIVIAAPENMKNQIQTARTLRQSL